MPILKFPSVHLFPHWIISSILLICWRSRFGSDNFYCFHCFCSALVLILHICVLLIMLALSLYLLYYFKGNLCPDFHFLFTKQGILRLCIFLFDLKQDHLSAIDFTCIFQVWKYFQISIFNIQIQWFLMVLLKKEKVISYLIYISVF